MGAPSAPPIPTKLYYNDGGISQKANPDLTPETIQNIELEASHLFQPDLRGVLYAFRYRWATSSPRSIDPADGLLVFRNLDNSSTFGIEAELEGKVGGLVQGRVSYAWQRTDEPESSEAPVNSPAQLARLNVSLPLADAWLTAAAEVQYTSDRRAFGGSRGAGRDGPEPDDVREGHETGPFLERERLQPVRQAYADPAGADNSKQSLIPQDGRSLQASAEGRVLKPWRSP